MALYKKGQLAKKYGKSPALITLSVQRGRLVMSGDYIDSEHPLNKIAIQKWENDLKSKPKPKTKKRKPKTSKGRRNKIEDPVVKPPKLGNIEEPKVNSEDFGDYSLDSQKKRAEIALKIEQRETAKLKNQKLRGESIPTDQVKNVITMLGHSFQSSYKNSADQFLIDACHKLKAPPKIEAELKGKLIKMINNSHENAITEAKKQLKSIIEQNAVAQMNTEDNE